MGWVTGSNKVLTDLVNYIDSKLGGLTLKETPYLLDLLDDDETIIEEIRLSTKQTMYIKEVGNKNNDATDQYKWHVTHQRLLEVLN